jgi:hypothetical protein
MQKLFARRPSAGVIIGFIALCVALGGGAFAAKKGKKIEYKGLSKDARLKVLPVTGTNAGTNCDPNSAASFTECTSVSIQTSTAFKRRVMMVFDGTFDDASTDGAVRSRGECRLQLDGQALNGTTIQVDPGKHPNPAPPVQTSDKDYGAGYGINIITTPQGGTHTYSVACNELAGNLKVQQFELSAFTVR